MSLTVTENNNAASITNANSNSVVTESNTAVSIVNSNVTVSPTTQTTSVSVTKQNVTVAPTEVASTVSISGNPGPQGVAGEGIDNNTYTCHTGVIVNKFVYMDATGTLQLSSRSDLATLPVLGVVKEKITTTTCKITTISSRTGFSGLTTGATYYLSTSGDITESISAISGEAIAPVGHAKNTTTLEVRLLPFKIIN